MFSQATVHQANYKDPEAKDGDLQFTFLRPDQTKEMDELQEGLTEEKKRAAREKKRAAMSKYNVLNQCGVGLFDHFLEQSDELWVLFIDRYLERIWCICA